MKEYFYTYRGNGYGPFKTLQEVKKARLLKQEKSRGYFTGYYWYGNVEVENQKLVKSNLVRVI